MIAVGEKQNQKGNSTHIETESLLAETFQLSYYQKTYDKTGKDDAAYPKRDFH